MVRAVAQECLSDRFTQPASLATTVSTQPLVASEDLVWGYGVVQSRDPHGLYRSSDTRHEHDPELFLGLVVAVEGQRIVVIQPSGS